MNTYRDLASVRAKHQIEYAKRRSQADQTARRICLLIGAAGLAVIVGTLFYLSAPQ